MSTTVDIALESAEQKGYDRQGTSMAARVVDHPTNDDNVGVGCLGIICRAIFIFVCVVISIPTFLWVCYVRVLNQYERAVVFRLGKLQRPARGPGLQVMIPCVDSYRVVDLRVQTLDVPAQAVITKDSVSCSVDAVVFFQVYDAVKSVLIIDNHRAATGHLAQTTLRSVIGECDLDEVLKHREMINNKLQQILDTATDPWGVKVLSVEIKDVSLPQSMQRSMASQAEAERERRAKIIAAEGELQSSQHLLDAANMMTRNPTTVQLRYLQTLREIATEKNSTIIFPLPMEMGNLFQRVATAVAPAALPGMVPASAPHHGAPTALPALPPIDITLATASAPAGEAV